MTRTPAAGNSKRESTDVEGRGGLRLCLASSSGGHLTELETVLEGLGDYEMFLVTVASPHSRSVQPGICKYYVRRIERHPANFVVNACEVLPILLRERPDAVISTGAGDMIPLMLLAAGLGIPVVFIESLARVTKPSLTGRLVHRWADLTIALWQSLAEAYPHAVIAAPTIRVATPRESLPPNPSILVLTGTGTRGFNRVLQEIDLLVSRGEMDARIFAQIGESTYIPEHYAYKRYLDHDSLLEAIRDCDLVITHDGAGSISESLAAGKHTIVVPRRFEAGELNYRSDAELARHLATLGLVSFAENPSDIPKLLAHAPPAPEKADLLARPTIAQVLTEYLHQLTGVATGSRANAR